MRVDISEIQGMADDFLRGLSKMTDLVTMEIQGNLQEESPVDHGRLQISWNTERKAPLINNVYSTAEYALVVSEGSDPYEILPVEAQALRFEVKGDIVYAKRVHHPGIKGTGYIDKAINRVDGRIDEFVNKSLDEVGL